MTKRILVPLLLGALALTACSSGSDAKARPKNSTTTTTTRAGSSSTTPNDTTSVVRAMTALPNAHFKVDYQPGNALGATATYWSGRRGRIDVSYQGAPYRLYTDANKGTATACVKAGASWTCKPTQAANDPAVPTAINPNTMLSVLSRMLRVPGVTTSSRTIAAQPAECASVQPDPKAAADESCLAPTGALLATTGTFAGKPYTLTATAYSTDVNPSDLDPPV